MKTLNARLFKLRLSFHGLQHSYRPKQKPFIVTIPVPKSTYMVWITISCLYEIFFIKDIFDSRHRACVTLAAFAPGIDESLWRKLRGIMVTIASTPSMSRASGHCRRTRARWWRSHAPTFYRSTVSIRQDMLCITRRGSHLQVLGENLDLVDSRYYSGLPQTDKLPYIMMGFGSLVADKRRPSSSLNGDIIPRPLFLYRQPSGIHLQRRHILIRAESEACVLGPVNSLLTSHADTAFPRRLLVPGVAMAGTTGHAYFSLLIVTVPKADVAALRPFMIRQSGYEDPLESVPSHKILLWACNTKHTK
ncbi:hypothetical protein BC629DRAFT_1442225 [Irpex lacteus]|nr:hypothetical protein BC629DRAFT_1442225 [Irpex lacteus]